MKRHLTYLALVLLSVTALRSPAQQIGTAAADSLKAGVTEILPVRYGDTAGIASDSALIKAYLFAGELYNGGKFEKALLLYQRILDAGHEAADLYYNMGNAAFRSNRVGHAVLYYEKALKLEPSHQDAAHNLEYMSRYTVDSFEEVPELFLRTWIKTAVRAFPERVWSILALSLFILVLVSLFIYLFTTRMVLKKTGFFAGIIGLILFIFAISSAVSRHRSAVDPDQGIILTPSVVVRSTPSESGTELFVLHEGTRVRVKEEVSGWHNIRIVDGREGWITSSDFGLI